MDTDDAWKDGVAKTLENPPAEKDAAVSGLVPVVAPTDVTLAGSDKGVCTRVRGYLLWTAGRKCWHKLCAVGRVGPRNASVAR